MSKLKKVDSFTNVDVESLTQEEKKELIRIKSKVEAQREFRERKSKRHICMRYNLWFYTIILLIAILFIFSVVFSVTGIRYLGLRPPSCVISDDPYLLPNSINPLDYSIRLRMNFSARSFQGRVDITIQPDYNTYCLFFHVGKTMKIRRFFIMDSEATNEKTRSLEIRNTKYNDETEIFQITSQDYLHKGKFYKLHLSYDGVINVDDLEGLYVSFYEHEETTHEVFSTHFESSAARSVFPCLDEPKFKSNFNLEIEIPKTKFSNDESFIAVANTPVKEIENLGKGDVRYVFGTTPKMSTYLVAFAMGPLQVARYFNVSVLVNKNVDIEDTKMILHLAYDIVKVLSEFFNYNYYNDINKLDLIGLSNFRAGAMENWGLITFREYLLITPPNATRASIRRNRQVLAHEISHQWIGNLVTPEWWSDIFLNEAGATFFQYLTLHMIRPEWNVWEDFLVSTVPGAFEKDSLPSSPSLICPVKKGLDVLSKFDSISYNKGGAILRMLWDYLGQDRFRNWINGYLQPRFHSNSNHTEFLESLYPLIVWNYDKLGSFPFEEVDDGFEPTAEQLQVLEDVRKVSSWYTSNGYPVVTVSRVHGSIYNLRQKRFVSFPYTSVPPLKEDFSDLYDKETYGSHLWWIPIRYFTSGVTRELHFIEMNQNEVRISVQEDWFKVNADSVGFYRVNYMDEQWKKLKRSLHHPSMTTMDRVSLVDDSMSLGEAGETRIGIGLDMGLAVGDSSKLELSVWKTIHRHVIFQNSLMRHTQSRELYQKYVCDLSSSLGRMIGWMDNEQNDYRFAKDNDLTVDEVHEIRKIYLSLVNVASNETVISEIYNHFKNDIESIPSYLNYEILSILVTLEDTNIVKKLWEKYEETKSETYLYVLGRSPDSVQFNRVLEETLSENVMSQDGHFIIRSICSNFHATERVFDWVRNNFEKVWRKFGMTSVINYILPALAKNLNKSIKEKDLELFFKDYATERSLRLAKEMVQRNIWWLEKVYFEMEKWLSDHYIHF